MGCGCAERRAKMKAWIKKQSLKRVKAKLERKRAEQEALLKRKRELENEFERGA